MRKLVCSLAASATFAIALATSSNAAPPSGKGGGGKAPLPPPRVAIAPVKNVAELKPQITPIKPIVVQPQIAKIQVQKVAPPVRINANLDLGSVKPTVRINFNPAPRYVNYHHTHGSRFSHGTYYRGRSHYHWSCQHWDMRYRCYCYWDPCCRHWYYWCQPMQCYYPVSYCPTGSYDGGVLIEPLAQIPVYSSDAGEPVSAPVGPMTTDSPTDESLPPIPAPIFR